MNASLANYGLTQAQVTALTSQYKSAKNTNLSFLLDPTHNGGHTAADLYHAQNFDIGDTVGGVPLTTLFSPDLFAGTALDFGSPMGGGMGGYGAGNNSMLAQMDNFAGGMGGRLFQIGAQLSGPNGQVASLMSKYNQAVQKEALQAQQKAIAAQNAMAMQQLQQRATISNNIAQQQQSQNQKMMTMFMMIYIMQQQKQKAEQEETTTATA
jgi:hypothetical protein